MASRCPAHSLGGEISVMKSLVRQLASVLSDAREALTLLLQLPPHAGAFCNNHSSGTGQGDDRARTMTASVPTLPLRPKAKPIEPGGTKDSALPLTSVASGQQEAAIFQCLAFREVVACLEIVFCKGVGTQSAWVTRSEHVGVVRKLQGRVRSQEGLELKGRSRP